MPPLCPRMIDAIVLCGFAQRSEYQHDGCYAYLRS